MIGETGARRDFRQALRALLATRLISAVGVVTLATAIGAVTAVFSLLNSVLLRPLPVHAPDRLMSVSSDFAISHGFTGGAGWSVPMWDRFQPFASRFDGAFAWYTHEFTLGRGIETAPVTGLYVSGEFFSTLGVRAERGRLLEPADDVRGGGPAGVVGVISHRLWRQRFAGTDGPPGTPLIVDGSPVTIVGVMPAEFLGLEVGRRVDVVLPLGAEPALRGRDSELFRPRNFTLLVMLRLKDGQPAATATAMLRQLQPEVVPADAPVLAQEPFTLVPAAGGPSNPGGLRPRYAQPLVTMLAGVGLVLVIACVNIANLQLARVTTRRRDLGIELALGIPRGRLARQVMAESVVLSGMGAVAGLALAIWIAHAIVALTTIPSGALDLSLDWRVLAFTVAVTGVAAVLSGAVPAIRATRIAPAEALRSGGSGERGVGGSRNVSGGLVVLQVALAVIVAVAAGLLVRTFAHLSRVPLGFDADRVIVVPVETARAAGAVDRLAFVQRLTDAVAAAPGVQHAAASMWTPLSGAGAVLGLRPPDTPKGGDEVNVVANFVTPGWFAVYGTSIRQGRDFSASDTATAPRVVVVNRAFVRRFLRNAPAIGQPIADGPVIVGVADDAVLRSSQRIPGVESLALREPVPPTIYAPLAQMGGWDRPPATRFRISARPSTGDPLALSPAIGAALSAVDPNLEFTMRPLAADVGASLSQERAMAAIAASFAALSLLLAALGLYGITAYSVSRRRHEIGLRLAVGATHLDVLRLIVARALRLIVPGIALGVAGAAVLARALAGMLFGLATLDPVSFIAIPAFLAAVGLLPVLIAARRATRIDPLRLLRAE